MPATGRGIRSVILIKLIALRPPREKPSSFGGVPQKEGGGRGCQFDPSRAAKRSESRHCPRLDHDLPIKKRGLSFEDPRDSPALGLEWDADAGYECIVNATHSSCASLS